MILKIKALNVLYKNKYFGKLLIPVRILKMAKMPMFAIFGMSFVTFKPLILMYYCVVYREFLWPRSTKRVQTSIFQQR